jgi:ferric hydroxamate transport system permease protein
LSTTAPAPTAQPSPALVPAVPRGRGWDTAIVVAVTAAALLALSLVHLTQGTSGVGLRMLLTHLTGSPDPQVAAILNGSRLPRLAAALLVGAALGLAGAALQSISRNALATPDTLAVNAGAHLMIVAVAAFGLSVPVLPLGGAAFVGGLAAAALVLAVSGGAAATTRLVLAGSAVMLALHSLTMVLILLFEEETKGLYAWGEGSLSQGDGRAVAQMAPVVLLAAAGLLALAPRLDLLGLGDDTAELLGLRVRRTKVAGVVLAVLLSAAAVTVAGPVGFVGLCAPALVRLLSRVLPGVVRHRSLLPLSALVGTLLVLGADVVLRAVLGAERAVAVPTGVLTSVIGAVFLVVLARRGSDASPVRGGAGGPSDGRTRRVSPGVLSALLVVLLGTALVGGLLLGDRLVLLGDLANWVSGRTGGGLTFVLDSRLARVLAAALAGAALAVAGAGVQAVARNPLAEPSLLGITSGAGVGAVLVITVVPMASVWAVTGAAMVGALLAFTVVYLAAWKAGLESTRLVLIGFGVSAGLAGMITLIIVVTDPWNLAKALTWLSGSTYGRTLPQVVPVAVALALFAPALAWAGRRLDVLAVDEDTPKVLGMSLERNRLAVLGGAVLLTGTAVAAVGTIGFVGLVAPHLARSLVGGRHRAVVPVAALLGALLVSLADTIGRTVIAPAQVPAGLVTALVGTPYFVWLLWRSRTP